jgi:choline-sulfatase
LAEGLQRGVISDAIIEGVDIVPTISDLLGLPPLPEAQGISYRSLLTGEGKELKPFAYSIFLEDNMAMVSNKDWKYVFMTGKRDLGLEYATGFGAPGITHFLYDLKNDPGESANLAYRTDNRQILEDMQRELLRWFIDTHPDKAVLPERLNMEGKLAWFCEPRDVGAEHGGTPLRIFRAQ